MLTTWSLTPATLPTNLFPTIDTVTFAEPVRNSVTTVTSVVLSGSVRKLISKSDFTFAESFWVVRIGRSQASKIRSDMYGKLLGRHFRRKYPEGRILWFVDGRSFFLMMAANCFSMQIGAHSVEESVENVIGDIDVYHGIRLSLNGRNGGPKISPKKWHSPLWEV